MSFIHFKVQDGGEIINVSYDASIKIREFILNFTGEHTSYATTETNVYKFMLGARCLNSPQFLDKQLRDLIHDGAIIRFIRCSNCSYSGPGVSTVDISKDITKEVNPGNSGLSYRLGCDGLCIRATCKNENCIAYNDIVYCRIGYVYNWNLLDHLEDSVLCPCCKEMVNPDNYYFMNCFYRIDYIKYEEGGKLRRGSVRGDAGSEKYKKFDEDESGKGSFAKMVFEVTRR